MYSTISRSDVFSSAQSSAGAAAKKYLPISFTHGDGDLVLAARMEENDAWEAVQTWLAVASWFVVEEIDGDAFFIESDHPPAILVKKVPLEPQKLGGGQYTVYMTGVDLFETKPECACMPRHGWILQVVQIIAKNTKFIGESCARIFTS